MAQAIPSAESQDRPVKPGQSQAKVVPMESNRKGKAVTPETVAVLTLFLG